MVNNFYNRETPEQLFDISKDFKGFLTKVTGEDSFFNIKTEGVLYELAVEQIDLTDFVNRNEIPDWFCGFINLDDNFSYISQQQQNINNFLEITNSSERQLALTAIAPVRFNSDLCLKYGIPGSYAYSKCISDDTDISIVEIDFASNAKFVDDIIKSTITEIESEVAGALSTSVLSAQADASAKLLNTTDKKLAQKAGVKDVPPKTRLRTPETGSNKVQERYIVE